MFKRASAAIAAASLAAAGVLMAAPASADADVSKPVSSLKATVTAPGTVVLDWDDAPGFSATANDYRVEVNGGTVARIDSSTSTRRNLTGTSPVEFGVQITGPSGNSPEAHVRIQNPQAVGSTSGGGSAPTPTPTPAPAGKLTHKPPTLTNPQTFSVGTSGATGSRALRIPDGVDAVVNLPDNAVVTNRVDILGGDDVVIVGGEIHSPIYDKPSLLLKGQTGTIHVEGLEIGKPGAPIGQDGIVVDERLQAPGERVQLVNIKVNQVNGAQDSNHGDVIQVYGGSADTDVIFEKIDGTSQYQGFMWQPGQLGVNVRRWVLQDIVLRRPADNNGGYLLFYGTGDRGERVWSNVKIETQSNRTYEVYPKSVQDSEVAAGRVTVTTSKVSSPLIGDPGPAYVSPGYK